MEGEEGGGIRLSKRIANGEVDYKTKSGTAWSHSYLNQKPWHPLSYPNQRRKWIAEQTHANRQRRAEEVSREFAQEQEFFRQTALISKKEKEKVELMQAVSFMYVRPPGYNAESAKAAEMNDEKKLEDVNKGPQHDDAHDGPSSSIPQSANLNEEKKKPRPKDVFGRPLPTEEEFEVLKNAPRLETGVPARVKPFAVEIRNVKCLRCGNYGHQSGDRECPLKDIIMPSEESRLKRDDPLNAILAHTDPTEPLKWELKQRPGISPPRGGFKPDDPNQQIVAEDIFDEYGGFLGMDNIPELLTNFSKKPKKSKRSKHKRQQQMNSDSEASSDDGERGRKKKKVKVNKKIQGRARCSSSETSVSEGHRRSRYKSLHSSEDSDSYRNCQSRSKQERSFLSKGSDRPRHGRGKHDRRKHPYSSEDSDSQRDDQSRKNVHNRERKDTKKSKDDRRKHSYSSEDSDNQRDDQSRKNVQNRERKDTKKSKDDRRKHSYSSEDSDSQRDDQSRKNVPKHERKDTKKRRSYSDENSGPACDNADNMSRDVISYSSDSFQQRQSKFKRSSHKHSSTTYSDSQKHHKNFGFDRYQVNEKSGAVHSYSPEDSNVDRDDKNRRIKRRYTPKCSKHRENDMDKQNGKKQYSSKNSGADGYHRSKKCRYERSYSSDSSDHREKHHESRRNYNR